VLSRKINLNNNRNNRNSMKKIIALALIAIAAAGCNTISGVGKDVQKVGQVITGAGGK
jgi:predicted small secreted protein